MVIGIFDQVAVVCAGRVMESANVLDLFEHPAHPYTLGLLRCVPRSTAERQKTFHSISGLPPRVTQLIEGGLRLLPRCERAGDSCHHE